MVIYVHQAWEIYKQRSICTSTTRRRPSFSERVRRPRLSDDVARLVQAIIEGRQQLPSDYWREFARGPYFIIAGESAHGAAVFSCFARLLNVVLFFRAHPGRKYLIRRQPRL